MAAPVPVMADWIANTGDKARTLLPFSSFDSSDPRWICGHICKTTRIRRAAQSYARSALKLGLDQQAEIGVNPFKPAIVVSVWADLDAKPNRGLEYMPQKPVTDKVWEYLVDQEPPFAGGKIISDNYLKFLVHDLKPFIDKTYRTQPDRENTFVMGSSMGGMISAYAITEYPDIFGAAACLSTAWNIGDGVVIAWYEDHWPDAGIHRIYSDHGTETFDAEYGPYQLKMDEVMQSKGYRSGEDWISRRFDGADHSPRAWRERLHIPLIFLLGNR